jgi:phosphoglycerate-specific signal transduction histidine kinase
MDFNRMKKDRIDKIRSRVADPLGILTADKGGFRQVEEQAGELYKKLSPDADKKEKADMAQQGNDPGLLKELLANHPQHVDRCQNTLNDMNDLIRDLNKILDSMRDVVTDDQALEELVRIEAMHREIDSLIRAYQAANLRWFYQQLQGGGKDKK